MNEGAAEKLYRHYINPVNRIVIGPLNMFQQTAIDIWADNRHYNINTWGDKPTTLEAETKWVWNEITSGRVSWMDVGKHWCPGYYDCLRCYPD